jgi:hypothetical protein
MRREESDVVVAEQRAPGVSAAVMVTEQGGSLETERLTAAGPWPKLGAMEQ